MIRRYEPVSTYLESLLMELRHVAAALPRGPRVTHIHWGGGSPNILSPVDIQRLAAATRSCFTVHRDAEFAVEIDPRQLDEDQMVAFAQAGVNRVSIGVQDFNADVQRAINRSQSLDVTKRVLNGFRRLGITSINIDLVYGLPHQTRQSVAHTLEDV